jgi:site-specific recombinase XerC
VPKLTQAELDEFSGWLVKYGRAAGTAQTYRADVRLAFAAGGPLRRLRNEDLAPKTRRRILAACRAWAEHRSDGELMVDLRKVRLPPAVRVSPKVPLEHPAWLRLRDEIDSADYLRGPMRAVLGIMANRGLRLGDVLRLRRTEIEAALDSGVLGFEAKGRRRMEFRVLASFRRYLELLMQYPVVRWDRVEDLIVRRAINQREAARRSVQRALVRVALAAKLPARSGHVHPHRLRRTYAVAYLRALRGDPEAIIKLKQHMAWAKLDTALEYVDHQRHEELDEVAERMMAR